MQGKIVKGIAGFYYVHTAEGVFECRAKGIFRKDQVKPLVGDDVIVDILNQEERTGNVTAILERKNELIRPAVANVDQIMFLFSIVKPVPNFNLLDRFLASMNRQNIPCILCFNKLDLASFDQIQALRDRYLGSGTKLLFTSVKEETGMEELEELLQGRLTVLAGPSGVGKSSVINYLCPDAAMETAEISRKIERGRHTTRHSEIFPCSASSYVCDTPGFSSFFLEDMKKEELKDYYPEFAVYEPECRYGGCVHINEPDCGVKKAVEKGRISQGRYDTYKQLYTELNHKRERHRSKYEAGNSRIT